MKLNRKNNQDIILGITRTSCGFLKHGRVQNDNGKFSYGGRSEKITVNRRFVSKIPKSYPLEKAAPVFCAGVTMFTPLKEHCAEKGGLHVGIMGFGGLGQMGVMMAKAMGNKVTVISTSDKKEALAKKMGADHFVISKQPESMKTAKNSLDILLDTVGADHDIMTYFELMKKKGTLVVLGIVSSPFQVKITSFFFLEKISTLKNHFKKFRSTLQNSSRIKLELLEVIPVE